MFRPLPPPSLGGLRSPGTEGLALLAPARSVNSFVAALSRNRESGSRSGVEGNRFALAYSLRSRGYIRLTLQNLAKNAGKTRHSGSSPRTSPLCKLLCSVSAAENQLPEKTCGKRTRWLTGAPVNQRVGLFRSHNVGPGQGACILAVATAPDPSPAARSWRQHRGGAGSRLLSNACQRWRCSPQSASRVSDWR
jgi:hypothetical protein